MRSVGSGFIFLISLLLTQACNGYEQFYAQIFAYTNFQTPDDKKPTILFLHGAPGTHKAFKEYYEDPSFDRFYNIIAIDRPRYGQSQNFAFSDHPTLEDQAKIITEAFKNLLSVSPVLIVGHSVGASLALLIAQNPSSNVHGLALISGAFSPQHSTTKWYNTFLQKPYLRWLLPSPLLNANQEFLGLDVSVHQSISSALKEVSASTLFIHGTHDKVIQAFHSDWGHEKRRHQGKKTKLYKLDSGHFVLWSRAADIKRILLKHYSSRSPSSSQ